PPMTPAGASSWPQDARLSPLTIVVPTHGCIDVTLRFLDSYQAQTRASHLVFVDDHSPDDTVRILRARARTVIEPEQRLYFNGALRLAVASCRTPFLGVLNNDLILGRGFVEDVLDAFDRSGYDFLVPCTLGEDQATPADLERRRTFRIRRLR